MSDSLHKNHNRYFVPGLARGLRVLEIIALSDKPLTIAEIGKKLGVSRSSAFRITYTLRHLGFLSTDKGDKLFDLGPRILSLGFSYLNRQDIIKIAKPFLEKLRDQTEVSSHLAILESSDVLYLDNVISKTSFVSNISTGDRRPVYASALGWLLLGNMDEEEIRELFADTVFESLTSHTPKNIDQLIERIEQARKDGFVISRGFSQRGGSIITAPIFDETGQVIAVIDISGPDSGFDFDKLDQFYVPAVTKTAHEISRDLGYKG
ncbi:MAG: IclR family transcriptional regulator [Kordiimonadaceae bacterium]|nr:IclR family transcriptional regulator [Kordiimonadaceae bacterium]MBT6031165.1 IclR family transcriptional regulator [Kordiimonadaceae bacterium]